MVATRSTDARLNGLEQNVGEVEKRVDSVKAAVGELNAQFQKTDERVSAVTTAQDQ